VEVDESNVSNKTFNLILIYTIEVLQGLWYYRGYVCGKSDPLNKAKRNTCKIRGNKSGNDNIVKVRMD